MTYDKAVKAIMTESDKGFKIMRESLDAFVKKKMDALKKTETRQPDFEGEQKQAAIPSSVAKQAIYFGAMNVALRVIPRMAIPWLEVLGEEIAGRVLGLMAGKVILKKIPLAGPMIGILSGYKLESDYNQKMADYIQSVLGDNSPAKNMLQLEPNAPYDMGLGMRAQMNNRVKKMKARTSKEQRRVDPVFTHNPNGRYKSRIP